MAAEVEVVRVDVTSPGLVRVSAGQPLVALVRRDGGKGVAHLAFDGVLELPIGQPAAAGGVRSMEIGLRAIGGGALHGAAEVEFPVEEREGDDESEPYQPARAQ